MEEDYPFVSYSSKLDNPCPVPDLMPDNVEDGEQQENYESSDSESLTEIDRAVQEDMDKLEEIFNDIGLKFRMIDRIGEGSALSFNTQNYAGQLLIFCRDLLHRVQSRRSALRALSK